MDLSDLVDDWAPGIRALPDTLAGLRQAFDSGDLTVLADPTKVDSYVGLLLVGGTGYFAACLVLRQMRRALSAAPAIEPRGRRQDELEVERPTNSPALLRLWWKIHPPRDLMCFSGGPQINRDRKPHSLWLGPTGAGKSAAVVSTRCDGKRPMLVVTPDYSDPFIEACKRAKGFRWSACVSTTKVNFLIGSPTEVAERLTEVFRSGGTGAWKRAARRATAAVIRAIDDSKRLRSLKLIGEMLKFVAAADRELRLVCAGWIDRFLDLADQFGDSIGAGGVDIAELLKQGEMVVLDNDAFEHSSLGGDVVALGLAEAKRCAGLVPGGFRLVFEEAGQLGDRVDLADPFFRAGRRRKIAVDALSQAESDFDSCPGISANCATRVYFGQELKSLQKVAADRLGVHYSELDVSVMQDFSAYVAHGKIRALVSFPKPPKARVSREETLGSEKGRSVAGDSERRIVVAEVPRRDSGVRAEEVKPELPMLPPPSTAMQAYVDRTFRDRGCLRWKGKHDRKGHARECGLSCKREEHERGNYGYIYLEEEEKTELVHRWRWKQAYGEIGKDPVTGKKLTVDHRGSCARDCSDLTHLSLKTRGANSTARGQDARNGVSYR